MSNYQTAVELVCEYGVPVFPCGPDKHPRTTHGFKDASVDLERVDGWFENSDSLIGVPTGDKFFVVDVDPDGADWYVRNADRLACGCVNQTRRGWHLAYSIPPGVVIPNSTGKIAPGVDVRGTGGYIIWWPGVGLPSIGTLADVGPPPSWLLEAIQKPKVNGHDHGDDRVVDDRRRIPEGKRNDRLTRIAGHLRRSGLSPTELEAALVAVNVERCTPPLDAAEVRAIAASIGKKLAGEEEHHAPRWMDWAALAPQVPPPRSWRLEHWIGSGPMYLGGRGGAGKTLLAQQLGTALALQKNFLNAVAQPVKSLMLACEDDHDELWRRQRDICRWLGIDMVDLAGKFTIEPRLGLDNTLFTMAYGSPIWTPLRDDLAEQVNDLHADMVIVDNIAQTFGGSENDRHHVTAYINGLLGLRPGITVMLLGHPSKGIGSEFSGSTAWENAVRMRWYLGPTLPDQAPKNDEIEPDPAVCYISKRKANYTQQDWRRLTYTDGVLVPDQITPVERYDAVARKEVTQSIVLKGLCRLIDINMDTTPSANSPGYLPRKLMDMKFNEDASKGELVTALNALLADGKVVITDIKGADRHPRRVLRPRSECGK